MNQRPSFGEEFLSRYEVGELLGAGAFGLVYQGWHKRLRRPVAIKYFPPRNHEAHELRARFLREARLLATVSHPSVVTIYAADIDGDVPYLVEELLDGSPLDTYLAAHMPLTPTTVAAMALQVAEALAHTHLVEIIHRDVKPANLFRTTEGQLKLLDFGLAKRPGFDTTITKSDDIVGTPLYLAPEQLYGATPTAAVDIYALGTLIYYGSTGSYPFGDSLGSVIAGKSKEEPPSLKDGCPAAPVALVELVDAMLARDPSRRPTAGQVAAQLRPLLVTDATTATAVSRPPLPREEHSAPSATTAQPATEDNPSTAAQHPPVAQDRRGPPARPSGRLLALVSLALVSLALVLVVLIGYGYLEGNDVPTDTSPVQVKELVLTGPARARLRLERRELPPLQLVLRRIHRDRTVGHIELSLAGHELRPVSLQTAELLVPLPCPLAQPWQSEVVHQQTGERFFSTTLDPQPFIDETFATVGELSRQSARFGSLLERAEGIRVKLLEAVQQARKTKSLNSAAHRDTFRKSTEQLAALMTNNGLDCKTLAAFLAPYATATTRPTCFSPLATAVSPLRSIAAMIGERNGLPVPWQYDCSRLLGIRFEHLSQGLPPTGWQIVWDLPCKEQTGDKVTAYTLLATTAFKERQLSSAGRSFDIAWKSVLEILDTYGALHLHRDDVPQPADLETAYAVHIPAPIPPTGQLTLAIELELFARSTVIELRSRSVVAASIVNTSALVQYPGEAHKPPSLLRRLRVLVPIATSLVDTDGLPLRIRVRTLPGQAMIHPVSLCRLTLLAPQSTAPQSTAPQSTASQKVAPQQ